MAKAQGKKASAGKKSPAKKVAARVKSAVSAAKKKVAAKKPPKPAKKATAAKPKAPAKVTAKAPAKATAKTVAKVKAVAKKVKVVAKKVVKAPIKAAIKAAPKPAAKPAPKAAPKPAPKPAAKPAPKPEAKAAAPKPAAKTPAAKPAKLEVKPAAVPPPPARGPVAPKVLGAPKVEKRARRPRLRVTSSGAPAAAWLSTEKPRPASFIPAPPRAEAPSAIAAPPASSDRLIRPEEIIELAVRTVPVRVDIEQGAGRFYVIANPIEVTLKPGEGIEWDFRYLGGADVNVDDVVVEFERPSPFPAVTFKTRKPGGARPHRQLSGPVNASAAGRRSQYTIRAMSQYKTELANARMILAVILTDDR